MPLKSYGVLSGRVADTRREGNNDTPHYQIELVDDSGVHYRVAVNVQSQQEPSELLYCVVDDFKHPITLELPAPGSGWTSLPSGPGGAGLDFIRANLFDPASMRALPPDVAGPDNDLADLLDHHVQKAQRDSAAHVYVFGERWGPETIADNVFGFRPGNGVHDVHMNQGNDDKFRRDDGVWQDGGLLIRFGDQPRWVAVFLAFQSQSWHTDDKTGHALDGDTERPIAGGEAVRIIGALVNPVGPAPEAETITLINASAAPVDLTGWQLVDRMKATCPLPGRTLAAGATIQLGLSNGTQLGNKGGAMSVLDAAGRKVHGVSYTAEQARREGGRSRSKRFDGLGGVLTQWRTVANVTAADVQLMQGLAQRVTAIRPDLVNSDASFGELAWSWGKGHASDDASWRRRLWFADGDLVAWGWAQLPRQVRRNDGSVKDVTGAYLAYQVHPDHAGLVDEVIDWYDSTAPDLERTVLPGAADGFALKRWAAHGYETDQAALGDTGSWTQLNERDLTDIEQPVLPDGFRFRTADEAGPEAAVQAHLAAWTPSPYTAQAYEGVRQTDAYRGDLHILVEAPDGTMASSTIMWLDEVNKTAEFEPVGTHPGYRRLGLARAMLLHGMHQVRAAGATHMTVACLGAPGHPQARGLYYSVGFRELSRDAPLIKKSD